MKQVSITNMTDDQLHDERYSVQCKIDSGVISWENASKEIRTCPFNAFNHTGKIASPVDTNDWKSAVAVQNRVEAERRNGGSLASVRAGYQKKADTASATVRTTGLKASEATVTVQLAEAQRLSDRLRRINVELKERSDRQAAADAIAAEVKAARQLKADAAKAATVEAVKAGTMTIEEALTVMPELFATAN